MSERSAIDAYLAELSALLGWRRFLERRALAELRDHLECAVRAHGSRGLTETEAQRAALDALGTVEESLHAVVESNKALRALRMADDRVLVVACLLTLPGILLLGLSFLTFNFPCWPVEIEHGAAAYAGQRCGVPALQSLRPWLADFGLYGMPQWYQVTQFVVTTLGPLAAALLLLRAQTDVRSDRSEEAATAVVVIEPVAHRMAALVMSAAVFVTVAAYKLAS